MYNQKVIQNSTKGTNPRWTQMVKEAVSHVYEAVLEATDADTDNSVRKYHGN